MRCLLVSELHDLWLLLGCAGLVSVCVFAFWRKHPSTGRKLETAYAWKEHPCLDWHAPNVRPHCSAI